MQRLPTLILVVAFALAGALLTGCGVSSLKDSETATEAQAAEPTEPAETAPVASETAPAITDDADSASETTTAAVAVADNAGAWALIQDGAQTFAGRLDQANQSIASCQTDAAAGADFEACVGRAYTAISTAAADLGGTVDQAIATTDGPCREALAMLQNDTRSLIEDYARAVTTTDLTSRETLETRLGDDRQAYVDDVLGAAAACMG